MKAFLNLWLPIFLSNSIIMLGGFFDTIFLSHYSALHVAAQAVCLAVYSLVFVTGIGLLQGMMQELSEANGRRAYADIQVILKQSILIILVLSIFAGWLLTHADPLLHMLGVHVELYGLIKPCLYLLAATIPAHLLLRILYILTQSCGESKRVFYANILYLFIKVGLAYGFIFGIEALAIPAYGVMGAFIAHLVSQWLLLFIYYVFFLEKRLRLQWSGPFFHADTLLKILKIGIPAAIMVFIDVFTVSAIALLILPLGDIVVNAHQIVLGICGLMFMLPMSLGSAFSILVSTHIGAKDLSRAWQMSRRALLLVTLIGLCSAALVATLSQSIFSRMTNDPEVFMLSLSLLFLLCWMHVFDAILVITVNILRCWKVIVLPMFIFTTVLLLGSLGGGWYVAYHPIALFGMRIDALGLQGFWWMMASSYTLAALLCLLCLYFKSRRLKISI